jgi:hypothetical protein
VFWFDSTEETGWHYLLEDQKVDAAPRPMITCSYLVSINKDSLTLSHTLAPRVNNELTEGQLGWFTIPMGCIEKVEVASWPSDPT